MNISEKKPLARLTPPSASRLAEFSKSFNPKVSNTPPLPVVNWSAVGQQAPVMLNSSGADLPAADAVVIVWTDAEWAAAEHVFCQSGKAMNYSSRNDSSWPGWQKYKKGVPSGVSGWSYWGEYRLVQIGQAKVLLFKSNTHLDFPGQQYLSQLISKIINTVNPKLILSTGTAGGARPGDHIGTVNVVRSATLYETNQPQSSWPDYSSAWSVDWSVVAESGFHKLLFPVPTTSADLQSICTQFNSFYSCNYALSDLNPGNVNMADPTPAINNLSVGNTPLLTTDSFVVGTSSGQLGSFACVEMDDAIIAKTCAASHIPYGSARNISDPIQNASLPPKIQAHWGQAIYNVYGFYTTYNNSIAAWAVLSAQFGA